MKKTRKLLIIGLICAVILLAFASIYIARFELEALPLGNNTVTNQVANQPNMPQAGVDGGSS